MGPKHSRQEVLAGAVAVAFAEGLSALSFGRVAAQLGISDRMVVYYLPTKQDLVSAVLGEVGTHLQAVLAPAFTAPAPDHLSLARTAWRALDGPEADATFAVFLEALGLAAARREPYRSVVPVLLDAWIAWAATLLTGAPARRRAEASAAIALLDGLLVVRHVAGREAADRAARQLGLAGR